jgi:hypothetical protein
MTDTMPEIKKTPAGRGEVTAFKGEFGNFSIFRFLLGAKSDAGRTHYQRLYGRSGRAANNPGRVNILLLAVRNRPILSKQ